MTSPERDRSPVDQRWLQHYCDVLLAAGQGLAPGPFREAVLRRVEYVMDMLDAWQTRNHPREDGSRLGRSPESLLAGDITYVDVQAAKPKHSPLHQSVEPSPQQAQAEDESPRCSVCDQPIPDVGDTVCVDCYGDSVRRSPAPAQWLKPELAKLREAFDQRLIWTVKRHGGIPFQSSDEIALHKAIAELLHAEESARGETAPAPQCTFCKNPATCYGHYEGHADGLDHYACDTCCGHGNEDGHCERIPSAPAPAGEPKTT